MKAYLFISGTIFALFAVTHVFIAYEYWGRADRDFWSVLIPSLIAAGGTALAVWAFRLSRRAAATAA